MGQILDVMGFMYSKRKEHFIFDFDKECVDIKCTVLNSTLFWQLHKGLIVPKPISLPYSQYVSFTVRLEKIRSHANMSYYKLIVILRNDSCDARELSYEISLSCNNNNWTWKSGILSTGEIEANASKDIEYILRDNKILASLNSSDGLDLVFQFKEFRKKGDNFQCTVDTKNDLSLPNSLYRDNSLKDINLVVGNSSIMVHKVVLATRSEVFHSMLTHDTRENQTNIIEIQDASFEAIKAFVKYLYIEEVDNVSEELDSLVMLADKYDVQGLKERCESCLVQTVNEENVIDLFLKAELLNLRKLKERSLFLIKKNLDQIINREDFKRLDSHPKLTKEILQLCCKHSFSC